MHRQIAAGIDDREGLLPSAIAGDAALGELIGDNQPEAGVAFVAWVPSGSGFGLRQDLDKPVTVERQPGDRPDSAA
jgi:hypothetical protein